ncbi:MAG TPA: ammonium transporter, partial [Nakamurella sp.]
MEPFVLDAGNTAWMLAAASLVLLMTPALAFFYGGMTRSKSVLNMMMMSFGALAVVGPIWMLWGYSETFGTNVAGIIGDPFEYFALHNLTNDGSLMAATGVPATVAVGYQATFAIITVALISGAIADRARFGTWLVFSGLWVTLVYAPIAHMVWGGGAL